MSRPTSSGSSSDGVPPPKKIVSAGVPSPGARDLGAERVDVLPLHVRVEQPAVEVAVVADVTAEGNVEVEA